MDKAFNNDILALDVKCKNNEWGCKWEGEFQNYQVKHCVSLILGNKIPFRVKNRFSSKHLIIAFFIKAWGILTRIFNNVSFLSAVTCRLLFKNSRLFAIGLSFSFFTSVATLIICYNALSS